MTYRQLAASLAASLAAAAASSALAATAPSADSARIASQYSSWAGSRSNADALVSGLMNGSSITLVTTAPDRSVSLAGFTPPSKMSPGEVNAALAAAQRELGRLGISRPNAEQIQAALIGGEIELANGRTAMVRGPVAIQGGNPGISQVAAR